MAPGTRHVDALASKDLLFVCSSGGHLAHFMTLRPWWSRYRRAWVTFDLPDARARLKDEDVVWGHHPTTRNVKNLLLNAVLAAQHLRRRRPDVILSTGAGVAVPFFVLAKLLRIPTVYVEVLDRIETPTLTGRLVRPFTTVFCVQTPEQTSLYPGARVIGQLL